MSLSFFAGVGVYRLQRAFPCPIRISPWVLMGTSVAVISRLERGRQNCSPETLQRLARALDTRLVYSFEPTDRPAPEYVDSLVVVP